MDYCLNKKVKYPEKLGGWVVIYLGNPHSYNFLSIHIQQTQFYSSSNFCMSPC